MSALQRLVEIAFSRPCEIGAPLLHRLLDHELTARQTRVARLGIKPDVPEKRLHLRIGEPVNGDAIALAIREEVISSPVGRPVEV